MNRREALGRLSSLMALGIFGSAAKAGATSITETLTSTPATGDGPITIAHITDVHIFDRLDSEKWFARCLHAIQSHAKKPALILNTGDCVMDTLKVDRAGADQLWKLWRGVLQGDNSLPVHHCLGNHDHWGLGLDNRDSLKSDPLYGKKLGLDGLGLDRGYHSFDQGGWHFIALDSVLPSPNAKHGWIGRLDDEQFHWLENDLKSTPTDRPVLVYSHIPILQVASFKYLMPDENSSYNLDGVRMMNDARRIIDLFAKHRNVKLCLSGHLHLEDRVELSGVTYMCDGSVSGEWWKGTHRDSQPGFSLLTLQPDGTFDHSYESYGWAKEAVS